MLECGDGPSDMLYISLCSPLFLDVGAAVATPSSGDTSVGLRSSRLMWTDPFLGIVIGPISPMGEIEWSISPRDGRWRRRFSGESPAMELMERVDGEASMDLRVFVEEVAGELGLDGWGWVGRLNMELMTVGLGGCSASIYS